MATRYLVLATARMTERQAGLSPLSLLTAGISAQDHALRRSEKLCHNCDTKPVFAAQTDFVDRSLLLIPRNLLKTGI